VSSVLVKGLKRLEYRGYDSYGFATLGDSGIEVLKEVGKIGDVRLGSSKLGIAHTRWATHGRVSRENAHPHLSCDKGVAVVHNGIISNYLELRRELEERGHRFASETDSEVIAHLLEEYLKDHGLKDAMLRTVRRLKGDFSFIAMFEGMEVLAGARFGPPLVLGCGSGENFVASDVLAFIDRTDDVIFLDNGELVILGREFYELFDLNGNPVKKRPVKVAWEVADVSKKEFAHYTLKEIHEQPSTIPRALIQDDGRLVPFIEALKGSPIYFVGCGTSYHACLVAKYLLAKALKKPAEVILGSEVGYYSELMDGGVLFAISQSGETADVLKAVRMAKAKGMKVYSIVNQVNSTLARESDHFLSINCGPEIGVAATKSFTAQLALLELLVMGVAGKRPNLDGIGEAVGSVMHDDLMKDIAVKFKGSNDFYFVGRGIHYPIALEGALKLKELSYVHAEGMAAGELKHGTLALISDGTPVVVINPKDETYEETMSNAIELKSRGARIIGVSDEPSSVYDYHVKIPKLDWYSYPLVEVVPLQLLAYYMAVLRSEDPDHPRNLAKSVTVE